jgi:hypothetical protein
MAAAAALATTGLTVFAFAAVGVLPQWNGIQSGRAN